MADIQASQSPESVGSSADSENRTMAIVVYGLYLAAVLSCGIAGIAGVIVAYIKRGEAQGGIWKSHFDNQIRAFWIWLVLTIAGALTWWVLGLGFLVIGVAFVWFLYRTIKGLLRAIEHKPYA
jgi:uncharacterized membrane protein